MFTTSEKKFVLGVLRRLKLMPFNAPEKGDYEYRNQYSLYQKKMIKENLEFSGWAVQVNKILKPKYLITPPEKELIKSLTIFVCSL